MDGEDMDPLYADLELAAKQVDLENMQIKLDAAQAENAQLRAEIDQLRSQMTALVEDKAVLEKNAVIVYNTAMREIARKDREIKDLRAQVVRHMLSESSNTKTDDAESDL